jgi:hypothetical protein
VLPEAQPSSRVAPSVSHGAGHGCPVFPDSLQTSEPIGETPVAIPPSELDSPEQMCYTEISITGRRRSFGPKPAHNPLSRAALLPSSRWDEVRILNRCFFIYRASGCGRSQLPGSVVSTRANWGESVVAFKGIGGFLGLNDCAVLCVETAGALPAARLALPYSSARCGCD